MNTSSTLSRLIIGVRRQPWMSSLKRWIPEGLKRRAWKIATTQEEIVVAGSRMRIPESERNAIYYSDEYEPEVVAKLREFLRSGMVFCDVGANMGALTLLGAKLVGPTGRVFAFEPFPANAAVIRENVALNGLKNVTVVEAAVSETDGEAALHLSKHCGSHCLAENPGASANVSLNVKTIRLDSVEGLGSINVLKTDTEGTELSVLRSLGSIRPDNIIVEANTFLFATMGKPSKEFTGPGFLAALKELGFKVIENLTDPGVGVLPIQREEEGNWNLHLRPENSGNEG